MNSIKKILLLIKKSEETMKLCLFINPFVIYFFLFFNNFNIAQDTTEYKQRYKLGEIVVNANKLNTKLKDVTTRIEIIDEVKIKRSNGNRLPDILKNSASTFVKSYGISPALQTISVNGLGTVHTLILMDGVRLNSFQNSQVDLSIVPLQNVERIEIVNSGMSSIYGSEALGGVINIITKNRPMLSNERNNQLNVSVSHGSFSSNSYSISLDNQSRNFNIGAYFNKEISNGDFEYYYDNGIEKKLKTRENASYNLFDTGINAQYFINNQNRIRLISSYSYQDKNVPGLETGLPPTKTKQSDKNWNNILISENILSSKLLIHSSLNFQNNFMRYELGKVSNNSYKNIVASGSTEIRLNEKRYGLTTGYNYSHATLNSNALESNIKRNQHALFVSSRVEFLKKIKIFPSVRYDYISDIKNDAFTYKLGINYQPFEKANFSVKGNLGKNFRAPSFNDLYWKQSGNLNLHPENSINSELGLFYSISSFVNAKIEVGYSYIYTNDKIVWKPQSNGIWAPDNIEESVSQNYSFNLTIEKRINHKWLLAIDNGIKFIESKKTSAFYPGDITKDKYIPYTPLFSANFGFSIQYDFTTLNIFYSHIGERYSDFANRNKLSSINTINLNFIITKRHLGFKPTFKLEVNNLFNVEYAIISGYPMPLRNYKLTLSINY